MKYNRNLIIIAGQVAAGKTTISNLFSREAKKWGIPFEQELVSDIHYMLKNLQKDDAAGGYNHYHEWTKEKEGGHSHNNNEPIAPFIVTKNKIMYDVFRDFFNALATLPSEEKMYFAEWAGGKNINIPEEQASHIDVSFETIGGMVQSGIYPMEWIERVKAVIHPVASNEVRYLLNKNKQGVLPKELLSGKFSPQKTTQVLDIYGEDDFFKVQDLFESRNIPIYSIQNDGSSRFIEQLLVVFKELFLVNTKKK